LFIAISSLKAVGSLVVFSPSLSFYVKACKRCEEKKKQKLAVFTDTSFRFLVSNIFI